MPANVETMFYTRVAPWHGLGVCVEETLNSQEALVAAGLDWNVIQRPLMTSTYDPYLCCLPEYPLLLTTGGKLCLPIRNLSNC